MKAKFEIAPAPLDGAAEPMRGEGGGCRADACALDRLDGPEARERLEPAKKADEPPGFSADPWK